MRVNVHDFPDPVLGKAKPCGIYDVATNQGWISVATGRDTAGFAALAAETGVAVTVCHLPPGTSKWNKIEHRLFSHISMNWRGRPQTSYQVIIDLIGAATTRKGLKVHAELDNSSYPTGIRISDTEMNDLPILRRELHGR